MALACARVLATSSTIAPTQLLRQMASHYEPARGFGRGMKAALAAFDAGTPWDRCAFAAWPDGSRGNGGAVRVPAIAVARWGTPTAARDAARLAARVTHGHAEAIAFAEWQAAALALVYSEPVLVQRPVAFHAALLAKLAPAPEVVTEKLAVVFDLVAQGANAERAARVLGTSTLAVESVPIALWSFMTKHQTFKDAVTGAAFLGGDVDSICSLVGALAGALHGLSGIDVTWLENLASEQPTPGEMIDLADAIHLVKPLWT